MSVAFVLVRPRRAANVGAVARAMKNFGFDDLRVVGAAACLPGGEEHAAARALAWNSADVLEAARAHDDLASAAGDVHLVAATSGREDARCVSPRELAAAIAALPSGSRAACVFGPEDSGLTSAELDRCALHVRIPTSPAQPSLNLAQAAVIVAYELALAARPPSPRASGEPLAEEAAVERLFVAARDAGLRAGYLNRQSPDLVLSELRRLLVRAHPTKREIELLTGLCAQVQWAIDNGGKPDPSR